MDDCGDRERLAVHLLAMRYFAQYKKMHDELQFGTPSMLQHLPELQKLLAEFETRSVLDYGCGNGLQYLQPSAARCFEGITVLKYDPPAGYVSLPRHKVDGVICTDVLEHVPIDELPHVAGEIFHAASKWVFASVCCRKAKKKFPGGENTHATVMPITAWRNCLYQWGHSYAPDLHFVLVESP